MAKKIFSVEIECLSANRNKNGSHAQFANNVQQTDKGAVARQAIVFNMNDAKLSASLEPGKKYTVTITEE